jgi:3-hydroxybutyryl-CoA dehydrogenase
VEVKKIGVLGAGIMGAGIAQICAEAGFEVILVDLPRRSSIKVTRT